jgi:hypothetical protein
VKTNSGKVYTYRLATPAEKRNFIRNIELGEEYEDTDQEETEE